MFMALKKKNLIIYVIAALTSVLTFIFFIIGNEVIEEVKEVKNEKTIYEIAKEEAIKIGRLEPEIKETIQEIGPDGILLIPSITYSDIGGMGDNSNKSFNTNISKSNSFISFELAFSSYKGAQLTNYLTDYDLNFRNIVYSEIAKRKPSDFNGSKGRKSLLDDIKEQFNSYLLKKDLDPIIFGVHYKVFAITER
jgi:flagellar basal body-associated protein FliL